MNYKFHKNVFIHILVGMILTACATPSIRNNIDIRSIISPEVSPDLGITDVYMVGGNGADWAENIICSQDGSHILFGETIKSFGESTDFLVVKVSFDHRIIWARTYGGPHKDSLWDVISTLDGGHLMLGSSQSLFFTLLPGHKSERPFLVKISQSGDPQWAITLDKTKGSSIALLTDVFQTKDGGYVLAGQAMVETSKDTFQWNTVIVKLTQKGEPLWAYRYDQGIDDIGRSIEELPDSSLFIVGYTIKENNSKNSFFILKADANGLPLWAKSYSSLNNLYALSSLLLKNGNLLIVGRIDRSTEDTDFFSAKATLSGDITWSKAYGSPTIDKPISIAESPSDEYIIVGSSGNVKKRLQDGVAIIIGNDGKLKSSSFIGGPLNDQLRGVTILQDGKYRIALSTASFQATYSDILTAVWKPTISQSSSAFSEMSLAIEKTNIKMKKLPVNYKHVPLSIKHDLNVKKLSTETKTE